MAGNEVLIRISAQDNVTEVVKKLTTDLAVLGDQMTKVGQSMSAFGGGAGTGRLRARAMNRQDKPTCLPDTVDPRGPKGE